jgi:peroxiredoxin
MASGGLQFLRADFRGKVVLLAFLDDAKPSQRILSQLNELNEKLRNQGLVVVRVQEAEPNDEEANGKELARLSPTAAVVVPRGLTVGGYSEAFQKYGVKATPALFLIDRQGVVRFSDVAPDSLFVRCKELLKR